MTTKPGQRLAARNIRNAAPSAGFFTIGFAIAVLAASALAVGGAQAVKEVASASPPASGMADVEGMQPVDGAKAENASNVIVSQAPATTPSSAAELLQ